MRRIGRVLIRDDPLLYLTIAVIAAYIIFAWQMHTPRPFAPVVSDSMEPYLYKGHLVAMQGVHASLIEKGDVIVFKASPRGKSTIELVHRVVRVERDPAAGLVFWTKGDNRDEMDSFGTPAAMIEGRVKYRIPYAGYLIWFLQSKAGLGFLASMFVLYFLYKYGDRAWARMKKYMPQNLGRTDPELLERIEGLEKTNRELLNAVRKQLRRRKNKRRAYRQAGKKKRRRHR